MSGRVLFASIVGGLMILNLQPKSLLAAQPSLAGSWTLAFTPSAPASTPPVQTPGLATFTSDGSVIETDGTELAPGPPTSAGALSYGSPGHGIWQLLPSFTGFYILYDSISVDATGALYSISVTVATVTVTTTTSATALKGQYTTTTTGPTGTAPRTVTGTIAGTLIPHPPLP
jgi:hypothetical protein